MATTNALQVLTKQGEELLARLAAEERELVIDKFIFADVPERGTFPDREEGIPTDHVVYEELIGEKGRLTENSVIYTATLASNVGPFEFNWSGLYCSEHDVLVTVHYPKRTPKTADQPGIAGNTLVRSQVLQYTGVADITNITVEASTWQYNANDRMKKMDNDVAQAIVDQNGKDWFIDDGFQVMPKSDSAVSIMPGAGYVSGNRVSLGFERMVSVPVKPAFIYIDAQREGTPTGEQTTAFTFITSAEEKDDYTDSKGVKHFVCKLGEVLEDGSVSNLRPEGEVYKKIKASELSSSEALKQSTLDVVYPVNPYESIIIGNDQIPAGTTAIRKDSVVWYTVSNITQNIDVISFIDNGNGTANLNGLYLFVKKEIHNDLKSRTINIKNYGAAEYPFDSTDALILATSFLKSGFRFDFNGMNIKIAHKGVNSNPFSPINSPNQTTYLFAEKLNGLYFQNGSLICEDLDMSKDSLNMVGLAGCKYPIFDNFHIVLIAHGIPQYSGNGFETFASLIFHQHHLDGTKASGLQIRPSCSFKIFHPNGGSIGPKDGNPTHDYSGKLAGILNYGNVADGDDGIISKFWCEGAYFWECTARTIWCWHSKGNYVNKNHFFRCGENATAFCNYGIRVTHYGSDSSYDDNIFEECYFSSAGILISNNHSLRTPKNYSVSRNKAANCPRFDIGINAGVNAKIESNQFENVTASFGLIRFIQQDNSEWKSVTVKGNKGTNVITLNPESEGSGFIYSSANAQFEIDIEDTVVDGIVANGAISVRYYPQNVRRSNLKNCSNYGIYHGQGMKGAEYSDNSIERSANWAIGGYSDTQFRSFNSKIKNCNKGLRLGNACEAYGGSIDNCESTHLELRTNIIAKGIKISDGPDTISGTSAVLHMEGGLSKLIESLTINSSGRFGYGIRSIFKSYLVNVGVLGSYINQDIDVEESSVKINCYNDLGAF